MILRYGTPNEAGMSPRRIAHIARLAEGWVRDGIHPALVVLVARRGVILLHEAYGRLTPAHDSRRLERDSIFPVGSLTKPITATVVMQLVEDGVLGLNRPVQDYLPEFRGEGKEAVMVHHLLTHTSGLREDHVLAHMQTRRSVIEIPSTEPTQHPAINELLHLAYDAPLWKPPSIEMSYCNLNYSLLGEIVRRTSDRSLADCARARIFAPLGMSDTNYVVPDTLVRRVVQRASSAPMAHYGTNEHLKLPAATGGVYSTALDTATFGQTFLNGGCYGHVRILSPASVAEMTRNQIPSIGAQLVDEYHAEASWGYGWGIRGNEKWVYSSGTLDSSESFSHWGAGGVYLWCDPTYDLLGIYFSVALELVDQVNNKWCADLFVNAVTAAVTDV